jgi:hypothetical protein
MPSLGKITFGGKSGKDYRFTVYPLGTKIRKRAGLYVIASRSHDGVSGHDYEAVYVGHTEDLSQPFDRHHKAQEFSRCGANCICLHAEESEESRIEKEQDLVAAMNPKCND